MAGKILIKCKILPSSRLSLIDSSGNFYLANVLVFLVLL